MRWIIRGAIFILSVSIVGMTALFAIPADQITERVLTRLSEETGRDVVIRGAVRPRLFPVLGIRAEDLEIGNPDWVEEGPMVVAQALDVGVAWGPLIRGEIRLQSAELVGPRLILVRAEDGRVSWAAEQETAPATEPVASDGDASSDPSGAASRIAFDEIVIEGAALLYVDRASGRTLEYDPVSARVAASSTSERADVEITVSQPSGELSLGVGIGSLVDLLDGALTDLDVSLDWPGGAADFQGRAGLLPTLEGNLSAEAETLDPLFGLVGLAPPAIPTGFGRDTLRINSGVTLSDGGSLHLRNSTVALDGNTLELELDLLPGELRPLLRGNLSLGRFTLEAAEPDGGGISGVADTGGAAGGDPAGSGWPDAPIDASALFALDTDLAVTAEQIRVADVDVQALAAHILTEDGRSEIDVNYASIFGGDVTGQLVANARGVFSASASLTVTDIALADTLAATTGFERLDGLGSGTFSGVAQGASVAALMADLDGEGGLSFGQGAIIGLDIAGMIRNFDAGFQGEGARTVYDAITGSFQVTEGVMTNDDLSLTAPWGAITGEGAVDLSGQRMDYLVVPGLSARDDGSARVNVPVRIEGPWHDLSFRPDLAALADQELSDEIDALEDAAGNAARDFVGDRLGVEIDEGASREEAIDQIEEEIGDRLQEGITDGLRSLFD